MSRKSVYIIFSHITSSVPVGAYETKEQADKVMQWLRDHYQAYPHCEETKIGNHLEHIDRGKLMYFSPLWGIDDDCEPYPDLYPLVSGDVDYNGNGGDFYCWATDKDDAKNQAKQELLKREKRNE